MVDIIVYGTFKSKDVVHKWFIGLKSKKMHLKINNNDKKLF